MKRYCFVTLLALILVVQSGRVFLLGGAVDDDDTSIYNRLAQSTSKKPDPGQCNQDWSVTTCPKIAVATSASPSTQDGDDEYYVEADEGTLSFEKLFLRYGMAPAHITIHNDNYQIHSSVETPEGKDGILRVGQRNLELIKEADIIFFNGGDQSRHTRCWLTDSGEPNELFKVIVDRSRKNLVVLGGTSAGTMIMPETTFGGGSPFGILYFSQSQGLAPLEPKDGAFGEKGMVDDRNGTDCLQYDENGVKIKGFSLVPFQTDTHFNYRGRIGRIIPVMFELGQKIGVAVDEGACFDYHNEVGTALGSNGVIVVDLTHATKYRSEYFKVDNVYLNYLTINDTYNFRQARAYSTKKLITSPQYNNFTDSPNILGRYENVKLMTRLVDQTGKFNIGTAMIPDDEDYPQSTPKFKFTYGRTISTRGYFSINGYTASDVVLSIEAIPPSQITTS